MPDATKHTVCFDDGSCFTGLSINTVRLVKACLERSSLHGTRQICIDSGEDGGVCYQEIADSTNALVRGVCRSARQVL